MKPPLRRAIREHFESSLAGRPLVVDEGALLRSLPASLRDEACGAVLPPLPPSTYASACPSRADAELVAQGAVECGRGVEDTAGDDDSEVAGATADELQSLRQALSSERAPTYLAR